MGRRRDCGGLSRSAQVIGSETFNRLGYFPRLVLLLPHVIILGILLATHPSRRTQDPQASLSPYVVLPPPRANAREGSAEWLANIQAIQNLMGAL